MTIRKNFLFDDEIAQYLEKIAKNEGITQTQVVKDLIQEKYEEISVEEKLKAFESIVGCMNGMIGDDVSIQSIKAEMGSLL